jgi:hypothetical protein
MRGDDAAAVGGDLLDRGLYLGVERIELARIRCCVRLIHVLGRRIGGDQRVADVRDVNLRVRGRLPGMRIGVAVAVRVFRLARLDAPGGDDHRRLGAGRFHQAIDPAFEAEPVGDHDLGVGEHLRVTGVGW